MFYLIFSIVTNSLVYKSNKKIRMSYKSEILTAASFSSSSCLSTQFILKAVYLSRKLTDYEACYSCLNTKKFMLKKFLDIKAEGLVFWGFFWNYCY